jgi:iron-containing alcohol dehydrogenase-like protein
MNEAQQGRVGFGRAYGGPGKYIQRPGEIDRLPAHLKSLGDKAFLLVDGFVLDSMGDALRDSFAASGLPYKMERFHGECCSEEIARVETLVRSHSSAVVVGIGGGKNGGYREGRRLSNSSADRNRANDRLDRRAVQRCRGALYDGWRLPRGDLLAAQSGSCPGRQRGHRKGAGTLSYRGNRRRAFDMVRSPLQCRNLFTKLHWWWFSHPRGGPGACQSLL